MMASTVSCGGDGGQGVMRRDGAEANGKITQVSHWLTHRIIHYLDGLKTNSDSLVHFALQWLEIKVHTKQ